MIEKELPVLFDRKEECCGCTACYAVCPVQAIVMTADEEGFLYPVIYAEKCIGCRQCLMVCAFKNKECQEWRDKWIRVKIE